MVAADLRAAEIRLATPLAAARRSAATSTASFRLRSGRHQWGVQLIHGLAGGQRPASPLKKVFFSVLRQILRPLF